MKLHTDVKINLTCSVGAFRGSSAELEHPMEAWRSQQPNTESCLADGEPSDSIQTGTDFIT